MGFTFSFPVEQRGLNKGIMIKWTKGFNASGVVNKDVVELLKEAFQRRKVIIRDFVICSFVAKNLAKLLLSFRQIDHVLAPVAILNDTTGTLMSCAWGQPDTRVGLIVGE